MTRTILAAVAAVLCGTAIASAQTGTAVAPADPNSTTSDTRKIDQAQAPFGSTSGAPVSPTVTGTTTSEGVSPPTTEHWRTSNGFNNDPNNPSGAPK